MVVIWSRESEKTWDWPGRRSQSCRISSRPARCQKAWWAEKTGGTGEDSRFKEKLTLASHASSENRNILTWIVKNKSISSCWIHLLPPSRCVCRLLCWRCANNKKSPWRREVQFLVLLVVWFWSRLAGLRPPPLPPGQGPEDAPGTGTSGSNRGNGSGVNKCYGGLKFKNIGRNLTFTQTDSFGFSGKCVSSFSCSSVDSN